MKKVLTFLCMLAITLALQAQDQKMRVAVFDPSGASVDEGTREAVRELISSVLVNTGKYNIVERSLLQQVMKEQKFSNTDAVDESQATEIGKLAGANKIVLSVVSMVGGRNMLSIKMIDVKTATIDQQKTRVVSSNDLLDVVEPLALELVGEKVSESTIAKSPSSKQQGTSKVGVNSNTPSDVKPQPTPVRPNINFYVSSFTNCGVEIMSHDLFDTKTTLANIDFPAGWRLPTRHELECICRSKKRIENLKTNSFSNYFTGEIDDKGRVYIRSFDDCKESRENVDKEMGWIRLVR